MVLPISLKEELNPDLPRVAVLSLNTNAIEREIIKYATGFERCEVCAFTLYGADYWHEANLSEVNSFALVARQPGLQGRFDAVVLGASLIVFATDWHKTLFQLASNMICEGGELLVAPNLLANANSKLGLSQEKLAQWLGTKSVNRKSGLLSFSVEKQKVNHSVLLWLAESATDYIQRLAVNFENTKKNSFADLGLLQASNSFESKGAEFPGEFTRKRDLSDQVRRTLFGEVEYLGLGTGQKVAALNAVVEHYCEAQSQFAIVDHGSAAGLIPLQAMLENSDLISNIYLIEPLSNFCSLAHDLFKFQTASMRSRIAYVNSISDDYEYDVSPGVISFFHMFFLIEPEKRKVVFKRAYDALLPGGAILLLEIPKTPQNQSAHYYSKMMTWNDLEAMCEPYDNTIYLDPRYLNEVKPENFIDKPIVRIVRKPL